MEEQDKKAIIASVLMLHYRYLREECNSPAHPEYESIAVLEEYLQTLGYQPVFNIKCQEWILLVIEQ